MANRRPPWKIPAVIDPPDRRCIQINIPDDPEHIAIFWGVLRGLSDWQRWEREPTKSGTLVAQVWREVVYAIEWEDSCMGCCEDQIRLHRVTESGNLEVSTDDGTTWTPDPADPRIIGTALPNTIPGEGADKKCNAATNAIGNFKDAQAAFGHSLTTSTTVIGLALAIAGELLVLLLSVGTLAEVLVPLLITTAATLFGVLEADYNAEFTEAVWDLLTCDLFCTIGDDGQFTEGQLVNLQAKVDTDFSDNVALTFQSILRGWGVIGLNNACVSGVSATADCSDCECEDTGEWWYEFDFETSEFASEFTVYDNGSGAQGHYTAGVGYQPNVIGGACWLSVNMDSGSWPLNIIGWIVEHSIDGQTQFNRSITYNSTFFNLDGVNDNIVDGSNAWAAEMDGYLTLDNIMPRWIAAPDAPHLAVALKRLVLHGSGTNPFGADNYVYDPLIP